jgi:hypothetical protein
MLVRSPGGRIDADVRSNAADDHSRDAAPTELQIEFPRPTGAW